MLSMDEAHRRDYLDRSLMHELRQGILAALKPAPSRMSRETIRALESAAEGLWDDMLRVDRVWD